MWGAPCPTNYGVSFTFGPVELVGGALPLNLPERILKVTPLQLPEGTHQRDLEEAEEDLKGPAPESDLKGDAECVEDVTSRNHAHGEAGTVYYVLARKRKPNPRTGLSELPVI